MALMAYDPTRGGTVPLAEARVVAYVIDTDTGKRYSTAAEANAAVAAKPKSTAKTVKDSFAELKGIVAETKKTVQSKNAEIATIALEQAVNTGDSGAAVKAAYEVAAAQGGNSQAQAAVALSAIKAATPQPTLTPEQQTRGDTIEWSGGVTGGWKIVKGKNVVSGNTSFNQGSDSNNFGGVPQSNNGFPLVGTEWDESGWQIAVYADGSKKYIYRDPSKDTRQSKQKSESDRLAAERLAAEEAAAAAAKKQQTENAISILTDRFNRYGLGTLVPKIRELAIAGAGEATITLQLQETEEYKQRFRANQDRIKKGLKVLDPGDYLNLEDDYRQILRAYGLKQFDNDNYVTQFISNDISTTELSNRVVTAVQRVQNADPAILATLRSFYGISDNDLVAYVLDPNQQYQKIERQVAAAEIGAAAKLQGLNAGVAVSEQLAAQGITKAQAQKNYATIADILPTAEKLSDIYGGSLDEYRQAEAEQDVFNTLASAQRKRRKLAEREIAAFSGSSGLGKSSLTSQIGGNI